MSKDEIAVIGFDVINGATLKPISRRYNVRDAAEQFCTLCKSMYPQAFVRDVMGPADALAPLKKRRSA